MNLRPLGPEPSALARLSHTPLGVGEANPGCNYRILSDRDARSTPAWLADVVVRGTNQKEARFGNERSGNDRA